jgi:hypothetical protein
MFCAPETVDVSQGKAYDGAAAAAAGAPVEIQ